MITFFIFIPVFIQVFCVDLGLLYPKNLDLKYKGTETIGSLCVRKYITHNMTYQEKASYVDPWVYSQ